MAGGYLMVVSTVFFSAEGCAGDRGALSFSSLKRTPMSCNAFAQSFTNFGLPFCSFWSILALSRILFSTALITLAMGCIRLGLISV